MMSFSWFILLNIFIVLLWIVYLSFRIYRSKFKAKSLDLIDNIQNVVALPLRVHEKTHVLEESGKLLVHSKYLSEFVFEGVSQETLLILTANFKKEREACIEKLTKNGLLNPTQEKKKLLNKG